MNFHFSLVMPISKVKAKSTRFSENQSTICSTEELKLHVELILSRGHNILACGYDIITRSHRDTRTFSNLKSTHCTLLILLIINLVTKKSLCIVSKVQSIKLFAPCGALKVVYWPDIFRGQHPLSIGYLINKQTTIQLLIYYIFYSIHFKDVVFWSINYSYMYQKSDNWNNGEFWQ
jgi:membrane-associated HD superfamily phosphohydrolase